jgi:three-Cys-motif partner protein
MKNETMYGSEDGLLMNEDVGSWSTFKYRLIQLYCHLFTSGMKGKWKGLVYVDLYAGSGQSRVKGTGEILLGSPLIALSMDVQFDHYIFCEQDEEKLEALKARVTRLFPRANATFIRGDCNLQIDSILNLLEKKTLGLCFVDPYDLGIKFETVRKLAQYRLDLLCLLALHMDAGRAYLRYLKKDESKVDLFLGTTDWRLDWEEIVTAKKDFPVFLASYFAGRMQTLGFEETPTHTMHLVRSDDKNVPKYHLALFSRSPVAYRFWAEVRKYSTDQKSLW